jgi:RNase P subunit RPR2
MARIIRQGINPIHVKYHLTCSRCNSLIEFDKSEGEETYGQREGDYITFTCPCCSNKLTIDLTVLPKFENKA